MAIVLKDVEELKGLSAEVFEFDPARKYLLLVPKVLSPGMMQTLRMVLRDRGLDASIICGFVTEGMRIFELEHRP